MLVEYDGTDFAGYQRQPGRRTVQGELERALSRIMGEEVRVVAGGRTDAGVHAIGQVVSFHTEGRIPIENVPEAANANLPRDVAIRGAEEASPEFHARYSATSRIYRYTVVNRPTRSALLGRYAMVVHKPIPVAEMASAAKPLVGTHDFAGFALAGDHRSTVRTLIRLSVDGSPQAATVTIQADGFLRGMVRFLVSGLLATAQGKLSPEELVRILETGQRPAWLCPVPPQGLCLARVTY